MTTEVALKVDVCNHRALHVGLPELLRTLDRAGALDHLRLQPSRVETDAARRHDERRALETERADDTKLGRATTETRDRNRVAEHVLRPPKLDRLRRRGLSGARDEVLLVATAQNLRKLAKYVERPPPGAPITCVA